MEIPYLSGQPAPGSYYPHSKEVVSDVKCNFLHSHLHPFQLQNWKINFRVLDVHPDYNAETADLLTELAVKKQSNQGSACFHITCREDHSSSTQNKPCFEKHAVSEANGQTKTTCL